MPEYRVTRVVDQEVGKYMSGGHLIDMPEGEWDLVSHRPITEGECTVHYFTWRRVEPSHIVACEDCGVTFSIAHTTVPFKPETGNPEHWIVCGSCVHREP